MRRFPAAVPALLDTCAVVAFVVIGRASHGESGGILGLAGTAWPFLAGQAVGELTSWRWRRPAATAPAGVVVWLSTVALGMILRVLVGQGTALAFIAVALAFLGSLFLGWRLIAARTWLRPSLAQRG